MAGTNAQRKLPRTQGASDISELMQQMGSKDGFSPIPPTQHRWQIGATEPPLYRVWSWMCAHTIDWGHRSPFAVDKTGRELHLEHIAADLDMDEANVRQRWKEGFEKGLWRNGSKEEGTRKLFLCGNVPPPAKAPKGEDEANEKVCTNLFRPYLLKQINELPEAKRAEFWRGVEADIALLKASHAELTAAVRRIFDQRHDTRFQAFGINKIREEHKKALPAEEIQVREARLASVLPHVERFVQTISGFVQTENESVYKGDSDSVPTAASLLHIEPIEERRESQASVSSVADGRPRASEPRHEGEKPSHKYVHKAEQAIPITSKTENPANLPQNGEEPETEEERQALNLVFDELRRIQQAFPRAGLSQDEFSRDRKPDMIFARRLVAAVGAARIVPFLLYVAAEFKGLDHSALAKRPGRPPGSPNGPRSFGLLLDWAKDFARRGGAQ